MKKLIAVILICLSVFALGGCCFSHDWQEATCTAPKTCSKCGKTEGEPLPHTWKEATCEKPKTCSVCGATEGSPLGHKWIEATCTEPKTCSVCGKTSGAPLGHSATPATCTEDSVCSRCGETLAKATGHDWEKATVSKPKTCKTCGATDGKPLGYTYFSMDSYAFIDAYNRSKHALGTLRKDSNTMKISGTNIEVTLFVFDESDKNNNYITGYWSIPDRKFIEMQIRLTTYGSDKRSDNGLAAILMIGQSFAEVFDSTFDCNTFAENCTVTASSGNAFTLTYSHSKYEYEVNGKGYSYSGGIYQYDFKISLSANKE